MPEQSIAAASKALLDAGFIADGEGNYVRSLEECVSVRESGGCPISLWVQVEDIPVLLRYKETAKELAQVRAGAASITDSLAAAHQENARLAEERDCCVKEIERVKDVKEAERWLRVDAEQERDSAMAERDRLTKEVEYLHQRERDICQAVPMVSDNGKYREDIISAVGGVVERNARLTKEVERLNKVLAAYAYWYPRRRMPSGQGMCELSCGHGGATGAPMCKKCADALIDETLTGLRGGGNSE